MVIHREDGVYWLESHKQNIWVDRIALYLDLGGGPTSVYVCKMSQSCANNIGVVYYI